MRYNRISVNFGTFNDANQKQSSQLPLWKYMENKQGWLAEDMAHGNWGQAKFLFLYIS